jgi:replicative DNA helicase
VIKKNDTKTEDIQLEVSLLGALAASVDDDRARATKFFMTSSIHESDFSSRNNFLAFQAIHGLYKISLPCSLDNLVREFATHGVENGMMLAMEVTSGYMPFTLDGYWEKLRQIADRRKTIQTLSEAINKLQFGSTSVADVRSSVATKLLHTRSQAEIETLSDYILKAGMHIEDTMHGNLPPVITTGIKKLDEVILGWQPTLILIGAQPGVGKSSLMATAVDCLAKRDIKTAVFSLEDEPTWLAWRMMAKESGVAQGRMRFSRVSDYEYGNVTSAAEKIMAHSDSVFVVDGSDTSMTIDDVTSACHDMVQNKGVQVIFVDHIGEIQHTTDQRDEEIANNLSKLRSIANKYNVPVIVFAHTKRLPDSQLDKNGNEIERLPKMSDFANSAGAERKARIALILTRSVGSDKLKVHVLKQTNGPPGAIIELEYNGLAAMVNAVEGPLEASARRKFV